MQSYSKVQTPSDPLIQQRSKGSIPTDLVNVDTWPEANGARDGTPSCQNARPISYSRLDTVTLHLKQATEIFKGGKTYLTRQIAPGVPRPASSPNRAAAPRSVGVEASPRTSTPSGSSTMGRRRGRVFPSGSSGESRGKGQRDQTQKEHRVSKADAVTFGRPRCGGRQI